MTGRTGIHLGRFGVIALAAFAIGLPVIVVILMERNAPIWPYVPVVLGSWVIVVLILRAAVRSKILFSERAHVRDIARQEISGLEARIDDVQQKDRDKN